MERIECYNIIECIINSNIFEMTRKWDLIKALVTLRGKGK